MATGRLDRPIVAWRDLPRWPDERIFWGVDPFDDLMLFETTSQKVGHLTDDGLIQPLDDVVTSSLQTMMRDSFLRWLRSEESWSHRSALHAPLAVALDGGGTSIVEAAYPSADGTQLMTGREAGRLPMATTAPAAMGFHAVYARSLGAAFRVGGTFPTHGASAGVWRFDLVHGTAFELYLGSSLGAVQAATYDAIHREIVVLDRVAAPLLPRGTYQLRLLRIDAFGRGARVVKTWTDDGPCNGFQLLVDGAGRLVVAASRASTSTHALDVLAGEGKAFSSHKLVDGSGTLASGPWSNEVAISVPVRIATSTAGFVAVSRLDVSAAGAATDVAECF